MKITVGGSVKQLIEKFWPKYESPMWCKSDYRVYILDVCSQEQAPFLQTPLHERLDEQCVCKNVPWQSSSYEHDSILTATETNQNQS